MPLVESCGKRTPWGWWWQRYQRQDAKDCIFCIPKVDGKNELWSIPYVNLWLDYL